jgi:hypothetical protein
MSTVWGRISDATCFKSCKCENLVRATDFEPRDSLGRRSVRGISGFSSATRRHPLVGLTETTPLAPGTALNTSLTTEISSVGSRTPSSRNSQVHGKIVIEIHLLKRGLGSVSNTGARGPGETRVRGGRRSCGGSRPATTARTGRPTPSEGAPADPPARPHRDERTGESTGRTGAGRTARSINPRTEP